MEKSVVIFNVKLARTLGSILKMKASTILLKADLGTLGTEFERERTRRLERIVLARLPFANDDAQHQSTISITSRQSGTLMER